MEAHSASKSKNLLIFASAAMLAALLVLAFVPGVAERAVGEEASDFDASLETFEETESYFEEDHTAPYSEGGDEPPDIDEEERIVADSDTAANADTLIVSYKEGATGQEKVEAVEAVRGEVVESWPELNAQVLELPKSASTISELEAEASELEAEPSVEDADLNSVYTLAWAPNDPLRRQGKQGNLAAVRAPSAWDLSRGGLVRIAVLDSGCYKGHVELAGKVVAERDIWYGDALADDRHGHGTHVSTTAAANTNNDRGISGGAPGARILCGKITNNSGTTNDAKIISGLLWAKNNGAKAVNLSISGGAYNQATQDAVNFLYDSNIFVAASSGNDNVQMQANYPAAYDGVMGVGATNRGGAVRWATAFGGSNCGPFVDISAPGKDIWAAWRGAATNYRMNTGTSMAVPHVAAAAALLAVEQTDVELIHEAIEASAMDRGNTGYDECFGHGLVNFNGALLHETPPTETPGASADAQTGE